MPRRGRGRGAGRAGGRGGFRGRGASRGGRGRHSSRRGGRQGFAIPGKSEIEKEKKEYNIHDDPKAFFTETASTKHHLDAQKANRTRYAATVAVMLNNKIQFTQNACIKALAMAWARGDGELASAFLILRSHFGLVEVNRALNMLDSGRQIRVLEKRLKCLQLSGDKVNPKKLGKLKSDIDNLNKLKPPEGSASGAVCKRVATWVRGFSAEDLEFFAVHFPKDPWKKLSDICHLNSEKDFPSAPWFLPFCYGTGPAPGGSVVEVANRLTGDNVNDMVKEYDIPFSALKQYKDKLSVLSKRRIAMYERKLDTVLWWYEDLACSETDQVISDRIAAGNEINLPNGKLLERLLTILLLRNPDLQRHRYGEEIRYDGEPEGAVNFFTQLIDIAEPKLTSIRLSLESPVVVIGDASGSMEVAIRTSTIIASLLTAICSARLVFFNTSNMEAPFLPKTVKEMLKLAVTTKASGGTAPAASLLPFYERKEVVKTFIMVTDEEENSDKEGYRFAPLYKKYCEEVFPAHLVFVSFLRGQHGEGQMVKELNGLGYHPKQLRLESNRPDLTKLDDMFAQMSAVTTSSFQEQLEKAEAAVNFQGIKKFFESLEGIGAYSASEQEE